MVPMVAWFDGHATFLPPARGSIEERDAARLPPARNATGKADLCHLLDWLGLWPELDADVVTAGTGIPVVWGADFIARRAKMSD